MKNVLTEANMKLLKYYLQQSTNSRRSIVRIVVWKRWWNKSMEDAKTMMSGSAFQILAAVTRNARLPIVDRNGVQQDGWRQQIELQVDTTHQQVEWLVPDSTAPRRISRTGTKNPKKQVFMYWSQYALPWTEWSATITIFAVTVHRFA